MKQSAIWVVDDEFDFRSHNKRLYQGREVLRQSVQDERRHKVLEAREKRGIHHHPGGSAGKQFTNLRRRKYKQPQHEDALSELSVGDSEEKASSGENLGQSKELGIISLAELLRMEEPDYIDQDENAALDIALATRSVDAVVTFSSGLMTPDAPGLPRDIDEAAAADGTEDHREDTLVENINSDRRDSTTSSAPHVPTRGGGDNNADNDDTDTQNEHWRKIQVRTPVDVPLDLLPAAQRLETLQVQEDMKIFSDESKRDTVPPKRYLRSAWWLPRSQWRVMDPDQPETLQNPHRARDFSAEGHTYLPMGKGLLQSGVSHEKMSEDDRKIVENEKLIENSTVGRRYKEYLIAEGFQDGKHLPHYLDACKIASEPESSLRSTQRTMPNKTSKTPKNGREKQVDEVAKSKAEKGWNPSIISDNALGSTPRLPNIKTPRG